MKNSFTSKVLTGAMVFIAGAAQASIDVDCFIAGRLRGDESKSNPLTSDLPKIT